MAKRDQTGKDNPNFGNKWTEKQRERMSQQRKGKLTGKDNPNWKPKVKIGCAFPGCQETKEICPSQVKERNYCCEEHQHIHHGMLMSGSNNPSYRGGPIKVKCSWCSKVIKRARKEAQRYNDYFCSPECEREFKKRLPPEKNGFYGKRHTEAYKQKASKTTKKRWEDPIYRELVIQNTIKAARHKSSGLELFFNELTPDVVRYVGNGKWWRKIDGHYRNPDFKITGQDKVIELFGNYWHRNDNPDDLINEYKEVGLECLIFWESEVYNETQRVINRVKEFVMG